MDWVDLVPAPEASPLQGLHPLVARALFQRGYRTPESIRAFLDPGAYTPSSPTDLPDLAQAAERILHAVRYHEPICVWGDFDVDGQTSTVILVSALRTLGADVRYHIPIRERESHGVNIPVLSHLIDQGARLILTCDTGIGAHQAVEFAHRRHVDMVITDHHDLPETLPQAAALVNPKLLPPGGPLSSLSGAGVAYKLAEELFQRSGQGDAISLLDLACLGLVADLAGLTGDARQMVQLGLTALHTTNRLGLQAMFDYARLVPTHLTEEHISYEIAPRLNALGRLDDANPAVEFFLTTDPARARVLANVMEGLNIQRRLLCSQVMRAAEARLKECPQWLEEPVLVVEGPNWPGGIVGIAAGRLVERYHKPAIVLSVPSEGPARGSARSVEGIHITAAIAAQKDLLLGYGGHPMAAGLSLEKENIPAFRVRLARTVEAMSGTLPTLAKLNLDAWLELGDLTLDLAQALEVLAPFGPGNEKLVLAVHGLKLESAATIGKNQEHLKLTLADASGASQTVLWWNGAGEQLPQGRFDLAFTLRAADWRGAPQVQMEFMDYRLLEPEAIELEGAGIEVVDHRGISNPASKLAEVRELPSTVVWAEGPEKKRVSGVDRNGLVQAENLLIWTTPASPQELAKAIETVQPKRVHLFAVTEPVQSAEAFLAYLAGLVKFILNQRGGNTSLSELSAAAGHTPAVIRYGLDWLAARGEIGLSSGPGETLNLSRGNGRGYPEKASSLQTDLQILLDETTAYRSYFHQADPANLLPKK